MATLDCLANRDTKILIAYEHRWTSFFPFFFLSFFPLLPSSSTRLLFPLSLAPHLLWPQTVPPSLDLTLNKFYCDFFRDSALMASPLCPLFSFPLFHSSLPRSLPLPLPLSLLPTSNKTSLPGSLITSGDLIFALFSLLVFLLLFCLFAYSSLGGTTSRDISWNWWRRDSVLQKFHLQIQIHNFNFLQFKFSSCRRK